MLGDCKALAEPAISEAPAGREFGDARIAAGSRRLTLHRHRGQHAAVRRDHAGPVVRLDDPTPASSHRSGLAVSSPSMRYHRSFNEIVRFFSQKVRMAAASFFLAARSYRWRPRPGCRIRSC